jgi:hypothetical protein
MATRESPLVTQQRTDRPCADLEAQLARAVADFEVDELSQMLDAAEAIRRVRRL